MNVKSSPRVALSALLILTGLMYLTLLGAGALNWDDDSNIFANPFFLNGYPLEFWKGAYFGMFVPVISSAWYALFKIGGGAVYPFRLFNAGLHVLNTALVYKLIAAHGRRRAWATAWPATAGAAFFALHPLQTQAVAWISGGRDLLATTAGLIALGLYLKGGIVRRAFATVAFAAALLSKPSLVTLPMVAWTLSAPTTGAGARRRGMTWLNAWLVAWLGLAGLVTWWTLGAQSGHLPAVAWWRRPWVMGDALWFYLTRTLNAFPLAANYARTPAVVFAHPTTLIGAGVAVAAFAWVAFHPRARAYAPFAKAAAWLLLPVSGLVSFGYQNISGVADHYAYPALAAAAAAFATGLATTTAANHRRRTATAVLLLLGWFTWTSVRRLNAWRSNEAFFTDMVRTAPTAYATALGMSNVMCGDRGDFTAGVKWTEVALNDRPLDVRALANQAYCLLHDHRAARVVDLEFYLERLDQRAAAASQPTGYASFLASIGTAKIELADYADGYQFLCEAERILPTEPLHRRNLEAAANILRAHDVEPACDPPE